LYEADAYEVIVSLSEAVSWRRLSGEVVGKYIRTSSVRRPGWEIDWLGMELEDL
jgi:hypothetical protein